MRTAEGGCSSHPRAPAERFPPRDGTAIILLDPNPPQRLQGRKVPEAERGVGGLHPCQELKAVCPNLAGECLAFTGVLRQARLVEPQAVPRIPGWRHVLLHPS